MKIYVYPTDEKWFRYLDARPGLDEVNFWQPGGNRAFTGLNSGELLLFRLKNPVNRIAGGGVFVRSGLFSIAAAWDAFGDKNGRPNYQDFRDTLAQYKDDNPERDIGCIVLAGPVFLPRAEWIDVPSDFPLNAVQGKAYDATSGTGRELFEWAQGALFNSHAGSIRERPYDELTELPPGAMWSDPVLARQRLGQGGFKVLISELYDRRCAISGERTFPVLEAAHIRPVSEGGTHVLRNGLLLRVDIHRLFDKGFIGVTPDLEVKVSPKLRSTWQNGRIYYEFDGRSLRSPTIAAGRPDARLLEWHYANVFKG